jgi:adenine-specific DNA-methyltransferase
MRACRCLGLWPVKYMGSKRAMLRNGLGELIQAEAFDRGRFVDLFSGSCAVTWFAADHLGIPVLSVDLQRYSTVLAEAVISRTETRCANQLVRQWVIPTIQSLRRSRLYQEVCRLEKRLYGTKSLVLEARSLCETRTRENIVWSAYGGYYFSPSQALIIDRLIANLREKDPDRAVCLAALIMAASKCAAAPGHTAQPFSVKRRALPHLLHAWSLDLVDILTARLRDICSRHARVVGTASSVGANAVIKSLSANDLVFLDPPYSGVQYSRFYHVLETIAQGRRPIVSGSGRYPALNERPKSEFSNVGTAPRALEELLFGIARAGSAAILTFPHGKCSNGLSGDFVLRTARHYFEVREKRVITRFSTLGGNNRHRFSRRPRRELVLTLIPKANK